MGDSKIPTASRGASANILFSLIAFLILAMSLGFGAPQLLLAVVSIPIANLFFPNWKRESVRHAILNLFVRSFALAIAFFVLGVASIKLRSNGGQVGYGDSLQISGSEITTMGYQLILSETFRLASVFFLSALLTTIIIYIKRR